MRFNLIFPLHGLLLGIERVVNPVVGKNRQNHSEGFTNCQMVALWLTHLPGDSIVRLVTLQLDQGVWGETIFTPLGIIGTTSTFVREDIVNPGFGLGKA